MNLPQPASVPEGVNRRTALVAGAAATAGLAAGAGMVRSIQRSEPVFIARADRYDADLASIVRAGLLACGLTPEAFRSKRVLLKPNLVEPTRAIPYMTTHPAVILAAALTFRDFGATVAVGEAPGHVRDTQMALDESGVGEVLRDNQIEFADLNYEETVWRPNRGGFSQLDGLYFPCSVAEADYVVSMPKLKTHHWVGMTAAMKNLYGVLPGIKYGWPKNVLHHQGIPQTVADIACTLPTTLTIVDAIDCMEGDGPILGSLKHLGLLLVGANLAAVDATAARIIGLQPERISYLQLAADRVGPIDERRIIQRGAAWREVASPFRLLDLDHLQRLRADHGDLVS